jgi:hypothetical protein
VFLFIVPIQANGSVQTFSSQTYYTESSIVASLRCVTSHAINIAANFHEERRHSSRGAVGLCYVTDIPQFAVTPVGGGGCVQNKRLQIRGKFFFLSFFFGGGGAVQLPTVTIAKSRIFGPHTGLKYCFIFL